MDRTSTGACGTEGYDKPRMTIRNPKSEIRNPKQIQNSNFENLKTSRRASFENCGFAHSDLFRISDFGFRIFSTIWLLILLALPTRAAEPINLDALPAPATNQVDFARDIKPIFERSCIR